MLDVQELLYIVDLTQRMWLQFFNYFKLSEHVSSYIGDGIIALRPIEGSEDDIVFGKLPSNRITTRNDFEIWVMDWLISLREAAQAWAETQYKNRNKQLELCVLIKRILSKLRSCIRTYLDLYPPLMNGIPPEQYLQISSPRPLSYMRNLYNQIETIKNDVWENEFFIRRQ